MRRSVTLIALLLLTTAVTRAMSPEELVRRSQYIVRAKALGYFRPPVLPRAGRGPLFPSEHTDVRGLIRFEVEDVIKGKIAVGSQIDLEGRLADKDDFNESNVPYRNARKSPDSYVPHAEYLLMLRESGNGYNVWWGAPSASNEQIHGENDPWVRWVNHEVVKESR